MEIIIALVVLAGLLYWFFIRKSTDVVTATPQKVEAPVATESNASPEIVEATVELAPVAVATSVTVEAAPAKKPRKPRAPKAETPVAKKAAPAKKAAAKKTVSKKA
jgi:ribonuclease E